MDFSQVGIFVSRIIGQVTAYQNFVATVLPPVAFFVAAISFFYSRKQWLSDNRPLVIPAIAPFENSSNFYVLHVQNYGKYVAKNVKLSFDTQTVEAACGTKSLCRDVLGISKTVIQALGPNASVSNSFGYHGNAVNAQGDAKACTKWLNVDCFIEGEISYQAMDGRKFKEPFKLTFTRPDAFGGGLWHTRKESDSEANTQEGANSKFAEPQRTLTEGQSSELDRPATAVRRGLSVRKQVRRSYKGFP